MSARVAPDTVRGFLRGLGLQRQLAFFAMVLFALALVTLVLQPLDPRALDGVGVWVKPTKFLLSIGVYALTLSLCFGLVRAERRAAWPMRLVVWLVLGAGGFELVYIAVQAARGQHSHFNIGDPFHATMYQLMGVGAVLLLAATLPLAWEIARRPAAGTRLDLRIAVVLGLVLTFVLGGGLGGYLSAQPGHAVGAIDARLPLFGWNRTGGDLRVAHFFGMHLMQALPLLALLVTPFALRVRLAVLGFGTLGIVAATLAVFSQALQGRPFL